MDSGWILISRRRFELKCLPFLSAKRGCCGRKHSNLIQLADLIQIKRLILLSAAHVRRPEYGGGNISGRCHRHTDEAEDMVPSDPW